jgi:hypothetical protein
MHTSPPNWKCVYYFCYHPDSEVGFSQVDRQDHTSLPGVGWKVVYDGVGTSAQVCTVINYVN